MFLPFEYKTELESVFMVDFLDLNDVNNGHGDINIDRNVPFVDLVKSKWSDLLVIVILR